MEMKEKVDCFFNYDKAEALSSKVMSMYFSKTPPFDNNIDEFFPDAILPKRYEKGSYKHALYLFHSCVLDSNRRATEVYSAARTLAEKIDLSKLYEVPSEEIMKILDAKFGKHASGRSVFPAATVLKNNSEKLKDEFEGDPRNLRMDGVWKTINNITQFLQYGPGKAALLLKNYVRFGIWNFNDYEVPVKVDRHMMRICVSNDVVDFKKFEFRLKHDIEKPKALRLAVLNSLRLKHFDIEDINNGKVYGVRTERFNVPLMKLFQRVTLKNNISGIALDDSFWAIGNSLCNKNDHDVCYFSCKVNCSVRSPSDNNGVWFFTRNGNKRLDKREGSKNFLF